MMKDASTETENILHQRFRTKSIQTNETTPPLSAELLNRISQLEASQKKNSIYFNRLSDELLEVNEKFQSSNKYISFDDDLKMDPLERTISPNRIPLKFSSSKTCKKSNKSLNGDNKKFPMIIGDTVIIGPNGTTLDKGFFETISWTSASAATRKILSIVFDMKTLATHSLTGKPSPAFHGRERPPKNQLDPKKIYDIIHLITVLCNVTEKEVRTAITTKCADTTKRFKQTQQFSSK